MHICLQHCTFPHNTHTLFKARNAWLSWQPESYSLLIQVNFDSIEETEPKVGWAFYCAPLIWQIHLFDHMPMSFHLYKQGISSYQVPCKCKRANLAFQTAFIEHNHYHTTPYMIVLYDQNTIVVGMCLTP